MKDLVPVSEFTSPVRAPEPLVDLRKAITVEEGLQQLTNRTEFLKDTKVTGPSSLVDREIVIADSTTGKLVKASGATVDANNEHSYITPKSRTKSVGSGFLFRPVDAASAWAWNSNGYWSIGSGATELAGLELDITQFLRAGQVITGVSWRMQPGAVRSASQRCNVSMFRRQTLGNFGTATSLGPTAEDDGTTNVQTVTWAPTSGSHTVDAAYEYYIVAFKGNATGAGSDLSGGVVLSFTDPGPRNA